MAEHVVNPSSIRIGERARFSCPSCSFSFLHTWLSLDGSFFGDSFCYMHDPKVEMVITEVLQPDARTD